MKQVSIRECESYDYDILKKSFEYLISDIGPLENFIKPNSKVLIKPNLVIKKSPEEGATTHPVLVRVVCEELLKLNCKVIIAESPGGPYTKNNLKGFYKTCGLIDELKDLDIKFNYDTSETKVQNDNAIYLKSMNIISPITKVDHVINLCKLKTHKMAKYTGGVKNLYGVIAGLEKTEIHYRFQTEELFCENVLLDICQYINPSLTIMDGVYGMEGEGPTAGDIRKIGVLLASYSPYALDIAGCKLINLDPIKVGTVRGSIKRNLIKDDFSDIEFLGDSIENFIVKDFKIPITSSDFRLLSLKLPKVLGDIVDKIITPKPIVDYKKCVKCGKCKVSCPAKVIQITDKGAEINLKKCIRCYCCHELCPKKAIHIKQNIFFKLVK